MNICRLFFITLMTCSAFLAQGQFLDRIEVHPWGDCRQFCGAGSFQLWVYRVEGQNAIGGSSELKVKADSIYLPVKRYSLDAGSTWTTGSFPVVDTTNQSNILLELDVDLNMLDQSVHDVSVGIESIGVYQHILGDGGCSTIELFTPAPQTPTPIHEDVWTGYVFDNPDELVCDFQWMYDGIVQISDLNFSGEFYYDYPFPGLGGVDYDSTNLTNVYQDHYEVRYVRRHYFEPGWYKIKVWADDGYRLSIDNQLYIDEWHTSNFLGEDSILCLSGWTDIQLDHYEWRFEAVIGIEFDMLTPDQVDSLGLMSACVIDVSLPEEDAADLGFNVYPNPTENMLFIEGEYIQVIFYDITGQIVPIQAAGGGVFDVSGFERGVYIMQVEMFEGGLMSRKVLLN